MKQDATCTLASTLCYLGRKKTAVDTGSRSLPNAYGPRSDIGQDIELSPDEYKMALEQEIETQRKSLASKRNVQLCLEYEMS